MLLQTYGPQELVGFEPIQGLLWVEGGLSAVSMGAARL